ncbi:Gfo/Idh/MocA family protein [Streptomyces griseoaurantiacus]|uniref:Predicted dehydrogenase n=1 Tax=Streptomyces griseoaurantiacus TaxID=68213 RepID=A0A1G7J832_9ACTN|nr:Gfo/Idh/MocA family oxidoreductase [Streptomyces jietaisiensis]SDF21061.1 Predicted dehydrogenase [Streptomyces jietaisiensis]
MRVGVIGAGLQCGRRISALESDDELVGIATPEADETWARAHSVRTRLFDHWDQLLAQPGLDAVIVATPPDSHLAATVAALTAGKHVLCEKPLARSSEEAARMEAVARDHGRVLHCGFNHRFHPAVRALARIVADDEYGRPLSALGVYGYGIREGYSDEWRADPGVVSGGQLMEQGIHLIDLIDGLLWPIDDVIAHTQHSFGLPTGIEDDAHIMLRSAAGQVAMVRSSLSQWHNRFLFEVTFERATARIDGLTGSYGEQTLTVEHRDDGPFGAHVTRFRGADRSWAAEWAHFRETVAQDPAPPPDPAGRRALAVVEAAYRSTHAGRWTPVTKETP